MKCMLETHIISVVFNWNDVIYKSNGQSIDSVTSQFTFELLGLVLYPFVQLYVYYKLRFARMSPTHEDIVDVPNMYLN